MGFPATFADIKQSVIDKLRLDANLDDTRVENWINQVYAHACVMTEATQTGGTVTLQAGTPTYTLPTAVVRMKWVYVTPVNGTQSAALEPLSMDELLRMRMTGGGAATTTGSVQYYALNGTADLPGYTGICLATPPSLRFR